MTEINEVPSPFCGVGTDDLTIQVDGASLKVINNGCAVNTPAFEQPLADTQPRVNGKITDLATAVDKAAAILQAAKQPLLGGCATDVNGMRALLALADKTGAVVDHMSFNYARHNLLTLLDSGWMNTTLAEVKNRCDVLLIIGADPESFAPRFFERYLWTDAAMFLENPAQRKIIYLGKAPSGKASTSPEGQDAQVFECAQDQLPEAVSVLRALIKGRPILAESAGGIPVTDLELIAKQLKAAVYGVVTWTVTDLRFDHAELTVQTVCEIVKDINDQGSRCSGLPLVGKEGEQTANQVCGWTTGYPARVSFAKGFPEYDPFLFDSQTMINAGEVDAQVWVQAFNVNAKPLSVTVPTIVLGRSGMAFEQEPDVFIPVGTPGIDHAGHAFRMDNVVAIRLKKLRDAGLPSTAEVLTAIERAV
jgi:formylmethanofuran dehydrogenase subunit B